LKEIELMNSNEKEELINEKTDNDHECLDDANKNIELGLKSEICDNDEDVYQKSC